MYRRLTPKCLSATSRVFISSPCTTCRVLPRHKTHLPLKTTDPRTKESQASEPIPPSVAAAADQQPPAAKSEPSDVKQNAPDVNQESPAPEQEKLTPPSAGDSVNADDLMKARDSVVVDSTLVAEKLLVQGPKTDRAAMQTVAKAAVESLKYDMQPQVDALWDAVKWMEDHMEAIDADRRQELEDASSVAAQNTAKVNPREWKDSYEH